MLTTPPRVVVVGASGAMRGARAAGLARHFGVPHLSVPDVPRDHIGLIADQLGGATGYVLDGSPRSLSQVACVDGLLASLAVPADLVVHLRSRDTADEPGSAAAIGYYEARGVLFGFAPDGDEEEILVAVEAAVRERAGIPARLPSVIEGSRTGGGAESARRHPLPARRRTLSSPTPLRG